MPDTRASSEVWRGDAAHEHGAQQRLRSVGHRRPRQRGHAVRALAVAPEDFTVAQFSTKVAAMTGRTDADYTTADYTTRQGAYDLRKLRGKQLVAKPPAGPGVTRCPKQPPAPSPLCSPSATRGDRQFLVYAAAGAVVRPRSWKRACMSTRRAS